MPWFTELKDNNPYNPDTDFGKNVTASNNPLIGIKLEPKRRYRVIKVNGAVDIHSTTGLGYLFTTTEENARTIFQQPYWIEFDSSISHNS